MGCSSRRPATYIAIRTGVDGVEQVLETFVSCPADVEHDARRLYGPGVRGVSWSKANRFTRERAKPTPPRRPTEGQQVMSKEWNEIGERGPAMSQIRVGDIVGVRGNRPGIYRVSRITQSGQFTLVSTDPQSTEKPRRFLPRGNEVGSGGGYGNSAWITGTDRVRTTARRCQYATALYDLHRFVEDLYQSHDGLYRGFGNNTGANGTPITRAEYVELARLAKLCLDDGQNADITSASLENSYLERKRRAEAAPDEGEADGDADA